MVFLKQARTLERAFRLEKYQQIRSIKDESYHNNPSFNKLLDVMGTTERDSNL